MKEKPIIMSGESVRAILDGRKTQTRRVIKPQPKGGIRPSPFFPEGVEDLHGYRVKCPYAVGQLLWVRETHWIVPKTAYWHDSSIPHRVSPDDYAWAIYAEGWERSTPCGKRSSAQMPRWASRLTLRVTEVWAQRLQDVNAKRGYPWESNPWVWAIALDVVK